tara:strand:+ start:940 stop:1716 length:777 start_codon:yes stop_codon:yes gene_type:complete
MPQKPSETEIKETFLTKKNGKRIAYHHLYGRNPGVIFLSGFKSDMSGQKAKYFEMSCKKNDRSFVRFDYFGHGKSDGKFEEGSISIWKDDALSILDKITSGPQVLVGSSMGAWIMLLVALFRKKRIKALLGIASAPDFTEEILSSLSFEEKSNLYTKGAIYKPSEYDLEPTPITLNMLEDAKKHVLLKNPVDIKCPVHLFHGLEDQDVPWSTSIKLAEKLKSPDVKITLLKKGNHRLSEEFQIKLIADEIENLCIKSY